MERTVAQNLRSGIWKAVKQRGTLGTKLVLGALLAVALAVIFILPGKVEKPWYQPSLDGKATLPSSSNAIDAPFAEAQRIEFRRNAQDLLAELLDHKSRLEARGVTHWAEAEFRNALTTSEVGDQLYQQGNYQQAVENYRQTVETLRSLDKSVEPIMQNALQQARQALTTGDAKTTRENYTTVLAIDSGHTEALAGLKRATTLPEVNELLHRATALLEDGEPSGSEKLLTQAVALDPQDQRVARALGKSRTAIANHRFQLAMSRGYQALSQQAFSEAKTAFDRAAVISPGNAEVTRARQQLTERRTQLEIGRLLTVAERQENAEQWREALATYNQLLALDPSLTDVTVKKIPAQVRANLDDNLQQFIDKPLQLSTNAVHARARKLLAEAKKIQLVGPRLQSQIGKLTLALERAITEIDVKLLSDAQTEVTLLRVKKLGQFETASVTLRPGIYTLLGSRAGYRDVRVELKITGELRPSPVTIQCTEPI